MVEPTMELMDWFRKQGQVEEADADVLLESFRNRPLDAGPYLYLWLDALVQKSRESGRIVNVTPLTAVGVNADGYREVPGVDGGRGWLESLRSLKARGLSGIALIVSDTHPGLKRPGRHLPRRFMAALPHPLHDKPPVPGAVVRTGPRGNAGSLHIRPA